MYTSFFVSIVSRQQGCPEQAKQEHLSRYQSRKEKRKCMSLYEAKQFKFVCFPVVQLYNLCIKGNESMCLTMPQRLPDIKWKHSVNQTIPMCSLPESITHIHTHCMTRIIVSIVILVIKFQFFLHSISEQMFHLCTALIRQLLYIHDALGLQAVQINKQLCIWIWTKRRNIFMRSVKGVTSLHSSLKPGLLLDWVFVTINR